MLGEARERLFAHLPGGVFDGVELPEDQVQPAIDLLDERGYQTMRNGASVLVSVQDRLKAEPIMVLTEAGYRIRNFDLQVEE